MVGPQKKRGLRALRHGWATEKKGPEGPKTWLGHTKKGPESPKTRLGHTKKRARIRRMKRKEK
jgi:hypothetical protein